MIYKTIDVVWMSGLRELAENIVMDYLWDNELGVQIVKRDDYLSLCFPIWNAKVICLHSLNVFLISKFSLIEMWWGCITFSIVFFFFFIYYLLFYFSYYCFYGIGIESIPMILCYASLWKSLLVLHVYCWASSECTQTNGDIYAWVLLDLLLGHVDAGSALDQKAFGTRELLF
jgi:hypothetical protein